MGQRGLVDAALSTEHGCRDHHGQMGVQVSRPSHASMHETLQGARKRGCSQFGLVLLTCVAAA